VNPYELTVVEGIIPEALIKDGEILITDEIIQGELAILSSIIIYYEPKGQSGPQEQEVVNIGNKAELLVIKPNPIKDKAEIYYQVNSPGLTNLLLYDITGRQVRSFINGNFEQGCYWLNWDGTDDTGRRLSEGVYFIRLDNQNEVKTQKVIIMK
ncbi:MAG: T9SS type A sorting domain-containing protein, partial [candidate division WOR-3 bacterium]